MITSFSGEQFYVTARLIARAFDVPMKFIWLEPERPVDRARRLRVERAMRLRARRAVRKGRLRPCGCEPR